MTNYAYNQVNLLRTFRRDNVIPRIKSKADFLLRKSFVVTKRS